MSSHHQLDGQVLVLAPFGKDANLMAEVLRGSGFAVEIVLAVDQIARSVNDGAGVAIIAEEALNDKSIDELAQSVAAQHSWSDFPIIVLTGGGISTPFTEMAVRARAPMGNITLLERPVRPATLISAVQAALRARRRQYEIRDHLEKRKHAEQELRRAHDSLELLVEKRTGALRTLSARLMRVQDEERRRIARELHDGMGQYLTAAKIYMDILSGNEAVRDSPVLAEARKSLEHAVGDIRTLSYLLHPPLLDEAGLESAMRWFVEGFAQRSGIEVKMELVTLAQRLPPATEMALFRSLQEALTNVHRHARCRSVDVSLQLHSHNIQLQVKDYGRGLPKNLLDRLQQSGTASGVGLAGIRERLRELGGELAVVSDSAGTVLTCTLPVSASPGAASGSAEDPSASSGMSFASSPLS